MDCHGHGSHVAGTVASKDYGVAPGATIVGVRVLSCSGRGSNSDVINGIFWAIEDAAGRPAVINMSLGGSKSSLLNAAVQDAVDAGITVVVAAGNSNRDSVTYSPASAPSAITVGSTTSNDVKSYFSNYGSLVDINAPGSSIKSTQLGGATEIMSGTSMAARTLLGLLLLTYLITQGSTPAQIDAGLKAAAVSAVRYPAASTTPLLLQWRVATDPNPTPTRLHQLRHQLPRRHLHQCLLLKSQHLHLLLLQRLHHRLLLQHQFLQGQHL